MEDAHWAPSEDIYIHELISMDAEKSDLT